MKSATPMQRFMKMVELIPFHTCWEWVGSGDGLRNRGRTTEYGRFALDGTRMIGAHRASYILHKGPIPEGHLVLHDCDNPSCVNPAHLRTGTVQDNSDDKLRKGRAWHQIGKPSPRTGTNTKWQRHNGVSGLFLQCAHCGTPTFQQAGAMQRGSLPACSPSCRTYIRWRHRKDKQ